MSTKGSYSPAYLQLETGRFVKFASYQVFVPHNNWFKLTEIRILENRMFEFQGEFVTIHDILNLITQKGICTQIPEGSSVSIPDLAGFYARDFMGYVDEPELMKEFNDIIQQLNNQPTTSDLCRAAYEEYTKAPNEENKRELAIAYEAVPAHLTCWLLGAHEKDGPILRAIESHNM